MSALDVYPWLLAGLVVFALWVVPVWCAHHRCMRCHASEREATGREGLEGLHEVQGSVVCRDVWACAVRRQP